MIAIFRKVILSMQCDYVDKNVSLSVCVRSVPECV